MKELSCGPWVCDYPAAISTPSGTRWTCPNCGYRYRMTRPRGFKFWRNWYAPDGCWVLTLRQPERRGSKMKQRQTCFIYCECGFELVAGGEFLSDNEQGVKYRCNQCNHLSTWDFDTYPVPVRIKKRFYTISVSSSHIATCFICGWHSLSYEMRESAERMAEKHQIVHDEGSS